MPPLLSNRLEGLADALFREAGDALFLFEPENGLILEVNPTAQRLSGFSREELLQMRVTQLMQAESGESQARLEDAQHRTAQFHAREGFLLRTTEKGVWIPVNLTITRLHLKPRPLGLITARDVREYRSAYARLKKVETEMRRVLTSVSDCLWSAKVDTQGHWHYRYCSPVVESLTGRPPKYFMEGDGAAIPWGRIVDPRDRASWESAVARLKAGESIHEEYRIIRLDGTECWVRENVRASRSSDKESILLDGVVTDITERRRADQELRQGGARKTAMLDTAMDCIISIDHEGRIIDFNHAAERTFGYRQADVLGKPMAELIVPPGLRQRHKEGMAHYLATGNGPVLGRRLELTGMRADGSEFPAELAINRIPLDGPPLFTAYLRDVTERKKSEDDLKAAKDAAEAASRAKSEFLATMSHEIRTPLNGILGMVELTFGTDLTPAQRGYLEILQGSAHSLMTVIEDILDFSKIEARKLVLEEVAFSLRETLADALGLLAVRAHQKGLELACLVQPRVPDILLGDPSRLRQIVVNLVGNAIKFTETGEVFVEIGLLGPAGDTAPELDLQFRVSDTGIGIPADKHVLIFEAFAQGDPSTTREKGGTGLGLGIAAQLVEMMGGKIGVESEVNKGSRFHFTVRLKRDGSSRPEQSGFHAEKVVLKNLRILVVDENANSRRLFKEILTHWGAQPTVASDEGQASEAFKQAIKAGQPFDLLLLDGGRDLEQARRNWEALLRIGAKKVPVVLMLRSANVARDAELCRQLGVDAYFTKPVRESALRSILVKLVGPPSPPTKVQAVPSAQPSSHGWRVLVAEDNTVNQLYVCGVLERHGHVAVLAHNGREALTALEREKFDAVLMDIEMPELDGFAVTSALRRRESTNGAHTPVIALTAHALKGFRERCLSAGMDDYLAKPIRAHDLIATVSRHAGRNGPAAAGKSEQPALPVKTAAAESFDRAAALARVEGNADMLKVLIGSYLQESPALLTDLHRALELRHAQLIRQATHALQGMLAVFSAGPALEATARLHNCATGGDFASAAEALSELDHRLAKLDAALRRQTMS